MWSKTERRDLSCTCLAHHALKSIIIIISSIFMIIVIFVLLFAYYQVVLQAASRPSIDRCEGQN